MRRPAPERASYLDALRLACHLYTSVTHTAGRDLHAIYEQGREDTELVKIDGKWLISKRYISSDSGLPDRFDETYEPRGNPLAD